MDWHQISEWKPEIGTCALVCFDRNNPWSCRVCSFELNDEGNYIWWHIDYIFPVDDTDYWALVPMPEPKIPAYKEED